MIKDLISELAYDTIPLTQGLTRAKLIQAKLKSHHFRNWLFYELNGYPSDSKIPEYRVLNIQIVGDFVSDFGHQWQNTPLMLQELSKSAGIDFYEFKELGSIQSIENSINQCKPGDTLAIPFSQDLVRILGDLFRKKDPQTHLMSAARVVLPSQYQSILDRTKQKLLDILLDLTDSFPNLQNDYKPTEENKNSVSNIITNNIYGNNNPMNIAAGEIVRQHDNSIHISGFDENTLKEIGVSDDQIIELKDILEKNSGNKENLKSKTMKWLGTVSASIGARGLYDNIPALTEFVQDLLSKT